MRLKLFHAPGMAAALAQLRSELGPDALILGSRRVAGGVEITAALEPPEPAPLAPQREAASDAGSLTQPNPMHPATPAPLRAAASDPELLAALRYHAVPAALHPRLQAGPLEDALAAAFIFGALPLDAAAPPLLLCGPPGAGKTLTAARLATRLVLAGATPLVVTADGKRAGATEQLAAFTKLLGINLVVACHPLTLGRALACRGQPAPALIDSPGGDPFDRAHVDELSALAAAAAAQIVLVLPAGMDSAEAAEIAAGFAAAGATALVATRLDLARRLGGILAAAASGRLALTEAGIGAGAADGLVPLTPSFLAERLQQTRTIQP